MTAQERAKIRRKWKRWLGVISKQVTNLLVAQHVWQEIGKIINSNPKIQVNSLFYEWLTANYIVQVGTMVRRLAEPPKNYRYMVSLYRLLDDIAKYPEVISKDYFFKRYNKTPQLKQTAVPQRNFDKFARKDESFISEARIKKDLRVLKNKTARIRTFVDQWVAHWDSKKRIRKLPTFKEADEAIQLLGDLTRKYGSLVPNNFFVGMPTIVYDWKKPLRYAWIEMTEEEKKRRAR